MKRLYILMLVVLGSCSSIPTNDAVNMAACGAALAATGVIDPQALLAAAVATPACRALAADAVQALIREVSTTALAQRRAMGRQ